MGYSEADPLAIIQIAMTFHVNSGKMNKDIIPLSTLNETITFGAIEPFDGTEFSYFWPINNLLT